MLWITQQNTQRHCVARKFACHFLLPRTDAENLQVKTLKEEAEEKNNFLLKLQRRHVTLYKAMTMYHGRSTYIFACVFFTKYHSSLPCSPDVRLRECVRRIFRPPAFIRRRSSSILRPYAHVRTAYGRRKEEKEEEGKGFFLGRRERDSSESRFDHGWGFPDASLRCAVNPVVAAGKRRKMCEDWYFWHFHFQHTKKTWASLASGYATFQSPVCPSSFSSSPFLVLDIHGEEEVKVLLALFSQ